MDLISSLLSVILFAAFVPGVLVTLPSKRSSHGTVLVVHALLFAVVTTLVMRFYWHNIKGYVESMSNFGDTCPNGFAPKVDPSGINKAECVPVGHATYNPASQGAKPPHA